MRHRIKIDTSLIERHGILNLLEKLKQENITLKEIEEIGDALGKSGRRALMPLFRRLWRERNGNLISKYAYLLDFFKDEVWLDQLIQIALKRRDLGDDAKSALFASLQGYGVDVSSPPFSTIFAGVSGPLSSSLPFFLDQGMAGITSYLDQFLAYPLEVQLLIIRELPKIKDPRVASLLEIFLRLDGDELSAATIDALGRIRDRRAVEVLYNYMHNGEGANKRLAERSLRRLSFLGVDTSPPSIAAPLSPFYSTLAAPLDGDGGRALFFARQNDNGLMEALYLQVHENDGVVASWGIDGLSMEEYVMELDEIRAEEGLLEVPARYALVLLRDALYRGRELGPLPADFYVRQDLFKGENLGPAPYEPDFSATLRAGRISYAEGDTITNQLFEEDYFEGWFMANSRVYDYADEWIELERQGGGKPRAKLLELLLERFCQELISPQLEQIQRRLLLTADLMLHTNGNRTLARQAIDLAQSLNSFTLPHHHHPFLRRYALESMDIAREALAEGYDLRDQKNDWQDED
jgi:hypothetical protein